MVFVLEYFSARAPPPPARVRIARAAPSRLQQATSKMDSNPFAKRARTDPRRWSLPSTLPSATPQQQPRRHSNPPSSSHISLGRRLVPTPASLRAPVAAPASFSSVDRVHDDIEDDVSDDEADSALGVATSHLPLQQLQTPVPPDSTRTLQVLRPPPNTAARPRDTFVQLGLTLRTDQLGDAVKANSSGRSSRKLAGPISQLVHRAASEAASEAQLLLVKHGVRGPAPPTPAALRSAMSSVRHRVLRLSHVRSTAPLVIAECECENSHETHHNDPPTTVRIVMQRAVFDRACGTGPRFVILWPWLERSGGGVLLVSHAESLG